MDITPLIPEGVQIIQSYAGGQFRVSGKIYQGAVIVYPNHIANWAVSNPMIADDFRDLDRDQLDVVLVGCGKSVSTEIFALRKDLKARGIHAELMDTGAACRTYNVLLTEGRRVAAALIPV